MQKKETEARQKRPFHSPKMRVTHFLALLLIIGIGFGLRLHNIDAFSFWTDEGLTPLRSSYDIPTILSNQIFIQESISKDTHPPFYYLVVHVTRQLFGETDFAYRYPSVLFSLLLIPLLYQFGRRLKGIDLGLIAAMLVSINPLQIWYANEARQYALLVLLAGLMSYVLYRALQGADLRRSLIVYGVLTAVTLYTHYTAIFLIGLHALFGLAFLWHAGHKKWILLAGVFGLLLAIPLIPFTIPRLFTGAEANYYYVSPLIMLQDVVHGFSMGLSTNFSWGIRLLDMVMLGLLCLGMWSAKGQTRLFLVGYMLVTVFGLALGSLLKPMYQGVRHIMIGSPAFLLLVAWGLVWLVKQAKLYHTNRFWGGLMMSGFTIVVLGPAISLNNLYLNSQYAKDDYRALIQHLNEQAGANDIILYNNAIHIPLNAHYHTRPDLPYTAAPIYPYMADENTLQQLEELAMQYERIWYVTDPPADGRDEEQLVGAWMADNLTAVRSTFFHARTTVVQTVLYDTRPLHELAHSAIPIDAPAWTAVSYNQTQPYRLPTLWVDLYWQGEMPQNGLVRLSLVGEDGAEWAQQIHPALPTTQLSDVAQRWQEEQTRLSYGLRLPVGMPPGTYQLHGQRLTADSTPQDPPQPLGQVTLTGDTRQLKNQPALIFENGLKLHTIEVLDEEVRPGHNLPVVLYWEADDIADFSDVLFELEVFRGDGERLRTEIRQVGPDWLGEWPVGQLVREETGIYFSPESEAGTYSLRWRVLQRGENGNHTPIGARPYWRPYYTESALYGEVHVQAWPLQTETPEGMRSFVADFADGIQLQGYMLELADNGVQLELVWGGTAVPQQNYFSFIHLLNEDDEIVSQTGFVPVNGLRPTKGWRDGEILVDPYTLPLPADLPAGTYHINVGLYQQESGVRLPITYEGALQEDNQLRLTEFDWEP